MSAKTKTKPKHRDALSCFKTEFSCATGRSPVVAGFNRLRRACRCEDSSCAQRIGRLLPSNYSPAQPPPAGDVAAKVADYWGMRMPANLSRKYYFGWLVLW